MSLALALGGWAAACALACALAAARRRLERVARAEHELRGPVFALALAAESLARTPATRPRARALEGQLDRLRAGLDDLAAARGASPAGPPAPIPIEEAVVRTAAGWRLVAARQGRRVRLDWAVPADAPRVAPGRFAQALGNLLANAVEHGGGDVVVRGRGTQAGIRVEVRDERSAAGTAPERRRAGRGRGRGLVIAREAAREAGGVLQPSAATLEFPRERP